MDAGIMSLIGMILGAGLVIVGILLGAKITKE